MFHIGGDVVNSRNHVPCRFLSNQMPSNVKLDIGHGIAKSQAENRHAVSFRHEITWMDRWWLIEGEKFNNKLKGN